MEDLLLWLYSQKGIGSKKIINFFSKHETGNVLYDRISPLLRECGLPTTNAHTYREEIKKLRAEITKRGCAMVPFWDSTYPFLLSQIPDKPACLFVKKHYFSTLLPKYTVAIVGTRRMSGYGERIINSIVNELCDYPIGIVSGLAYGVDAAVHRAVVRNPDNKALPIGILPGGPLQGYPSGCTDVYESLLEKGQILWEFLPGTPLRKELFACRNRLIAGLSNATIVIESDTVGGSMITASCALDYNRDVGAVPGDVFRSMSRGTNELIKEGAAVISSATDILSLLYGVQKDGVQKSQKISRKEDSDSRYSEIISTLSGISAECARSITEHVNGEGLTVENFAEVTGMRIESARAVLTRLEVKGILRRNIAGKIIWGESIS